MRKVAFYAGALILLAGCTGTNNGELVGVEAGAEFYEPDPYGMVYVAQGSFNMGQNEQDVAGLTNALTKTVTVRSFWMDETEITNSEYRQFVNWVRDSIAREMLGEQNEDFKIVDENDESIVRINWETELDYDDPENAEALAPLYYESNERFFGVKDFDNRKWAFTYCWVDMQQAAKIENQYHTNINETKKDLQVVAFSGQGLVDGTYEGGTVFDTQGEPIELGKSRAPFILKDRVLVYPDTLCWVRDFTYSYNEPFAKLYFWHPGFDVYPVVGVNWKQATAFSIWRSNLLNNYLRSENQPLAMEYRLPTEAEWEYAARGGLSSNIYPWGGYYTRNNRGCFVANLKDMRGRYCDDGSVQTAKVASYAPNQFGLYDMAGNVSEWTSSAFDESAYVYVHDMNPDYKYNAIEDDHYVMKRKVVRGGSWKDIAYYLQCGTRAYEYQDSALSFVGFRCVRDYIGE